MKKISNLLFLFCFSVSGLFAQLNSTLLSTVSYNVDANDIWGYKDLTTGIEYALVGLNNGLSIVSLEDPNNAAEVAFVDGPSSIWRDIKTWDKYAYVTNETGDGLLVVDMTNLPASVNSYYYSPNITADGMMSPLTSAHNLYIDELGYCYVVGANPAEGGMLIFDVFTDPYNPTLVGVGPSIYSHDIYVRDNKAYTSDVYDGVFRIYDVTDKSNIIELASQGTPFDFTHNAWLSDDSQTIFTTDERANAPVAAYDISDYNDIVFLDEYRPAYTLGEEVIPHNVHVWDDYLIISYYTDGMIIVDASRPQNLVEVGNFDTFLGGNGGFSGAWGAYPFLPSGIILATDIDNGLFVIGPDYQRASFLEGNVTDSSNGNPISAVTVTIEPSVTAQDNSDNFGNYKTGIPESGTFDVSFVHPGYISKTVQASLTQGDVTMLDVQLDPKVPFNLNILVQTPDGTPIPNAQLKMENSNGPTNLLTNASGTVALNNFLGDYYTVVAGKWGYGTYLEENVNVDGSQNPMIIEVPENEILDYFELDYGWTVSGDANTGDWVLGQPIGTNYNGESANPGEDIYDIGTWCYVTGNAGGGGGNDDVDGGSTILTSPLFDPTAQNTPTLAYNLWFFNQGGDGNPNDQIEVRVSNGATTVVLETITTSESAWLSRRYYTLANEIAITNTMRIIIETADDNPGHIVEAGFDFFNVYDANPGSTGVKDPFEASYTITAAPNPFSETLQINYDLGLEAISNTHIQLTNNLGQLVERIQLEQQIGSVEVNKDLPAGIYYIQVYSNGKRSRSLKVLKTN